MKKIGPQSPMFTGGETSEYHDQQAMNVQRARRERIATAVLAGLTASGDGLVAEVGMDGVRKMEKVTHDLRAFYAVKAADALIAELDKGKSEP